MIKQPLFYVFGVGAPFSSIGGVDGTSDGRQIVEQPYLKQPLFGRVAITTTAADDTHLVLI
jgi:hypothetical protein